VEGGWAIIKFYWHPNTFGNPTGAVGFRCRAGFEFWVRVRTFGCSDVKQLPHTADFFFLIPSTVHSYYNGCNSEHLSGHKSVRAGPEFPIFFPLFGPTVKAILQGATGNAQQWKMLCRAKFVNPDRMSDSLSLKHNMIPRTPPQTLSSTFCSTINLILWRARGNAQQ